MIACAVVAFFIIKEYGGIEFSDFDLNELMSLILMSFLALIAFAIKRIMLRWCEDPGKLTEDYEKLVQSYKVDYITFNNNNTLIKGLKMYKYWKYQDEKCVFPVICEAKTYGDGCVKEIVVKDDPSE